MAFIIAWFIFLVTLLWCLFMAAAPGLLPAPPKREDRLPVWPWFLGGSTLSLLIASTHYIGW